MCAWCARGDMKSKSVSRGVNDMYVNDTSVNEDVKNVSTYE